MDFQGYQKVTVFHGFSSIILVTLKDRLEYDLTFSHHELKMNFKMYLDRAVKPSEAFQLVDAGSRKKREEKMDNRAGKKWQWVR